jgi:nickel-dependent lactate racemase
MQRGWFFMSMSFPLHFGRDSRVDLALAEDRLVARLAAPAPLTDLAERVREQLLNPLELPPFSRFFVPGDKVVLALDRRTPEAPVLIREMCRVLVASGVRAEDIAIVQPAGLEPGPLPDPRVLLDEAERAAVEWEVHDATDGDRQGYLASTSRGERVYLSRRLLEADVVVSVGWIGFDPVIGYRGTSSVFYPGLSSVEAFKRALGTGHGELSPDDERPLRQEIDEIAWLMGSMFTVQVVPARSGGACEVLAGAGEAVMKGGRATLARQWRLEVPERVSTVVVAIDSGEAQETWAQAATALSVAKNLVVKGGRIVLVSRLAEALTPGLELLRRYKEPRDALAPLRDAQPPDLPSAVQVAEATHWARVYCLSGLEERVVEELFMTPLSNDRELRRLLDDDSTCAVIESAQFAHGEVRDRR